MDGIYLCRVKEARGEITICKGEQVTIHTTRAKPKTEHKTRQNNAEENGD